MYNTCLNVVKLDRNVVLQQILYILTLQLLELYYFESLRRWVVIVDFITCMYRLLIAGISDGLDGGYYPILIFTPIYYPTVLNCKYTVKLSHNLNNIFNRHFATKESSKNVTPECCILLPFPYKNKYVLFSNQLLKFKTHFSIGFLSNNRCTRKTINQMFNIKG